MAALFDCDKSVISRHIRNVCKEGELERGSVVAKNATTASDDKIYQVDCFNLDVIISVGYRVKSPRGVQFRQWVIWSWYSLYRNFKTKPRFRKAVYWVSMVFVPLYITDVLYAFEQVQ